MTDDLRYTRVAETYTVHTNQYRESMKMLLRTLTALRAAHPDARGPEWTEADINIATVNNLIATQRQRAAELTQQRNARRAARQATIARLQAEVRAAQTPPPK